MKHNGYPKDHKRLNRIIDFVFFSSFFYIVWTNFMILDVALEITMKFFNDFLVLSFLLGSNKSVVRVESDADRSS